MFARDKGKSRIKPRTCNFKVKVLIPTIMDHDIPRFYTLLAYVLMMAAAMKQTKSTDKFSKLLQWKSEQWKNNKNNANDAENVNGGDPEAHTIGKPVVDAGDNDDNLHLPIQRLRTGVVEGNAESSAESGEAACPT